MQKPKGGRGKKAPYETKIVRVPLPLVEGIESQINMFRNIALTGLSSDDSPIDCYTRQLGVDYPTLTEALKLSKQVLKSKKSARVSLLKLLRLLYKTDSITLKDLE